MYKTGVQTGRWRQSQEGFYIEAFLPGVDVIGRKSECRIHFNVRQSVSVAERDSIPSSRRQLGMFSNFSFFDLSRYGDEKQAG